MKKILSLLLAAALSMTFAACGQAPEVSDVTTPKEETRTAESTGSWEEDRAVKEEKTDSYFSMTPVKFSERMNEILKEYVVSGALQTQLREKDGASFYVVGIDGRELGHVGLTNGSGAASPAEAGHFETAIGIAMDDAIEGALLVSMIRSLDPSLSGEEAAALGRELIAEDRGEDPVLKNGIVYRYFHSEEGNGFSAQMAD